MNIYQEIWNADQSGSGVKPILSDQAGDPTQGYVKVAAVATGNAEFKVLPEVRIPEAKMRTYSLVRALFDNYALDESALEVETPQEREEVHNLLAAVVDSAPMQVARRYVEEATNTVVTSERWYATLLELWFRRFAQGGDPELSGFEHVFVGEQEGAKAQGYHFWYKYYLDDGLASTIDRSRLPGFKDDRITYLRGQYGNGQENFPESVTISYKWDAPDYDRGVTRPLTKPKGGFFVGCSVEGLMALGAVRAHVGARAPKEAVINGARYDLRIYRSENNQNIRTFFPVYLGPATGDDNGSGGSPDPGGEQPTQPTVDNPVRIIAALVNPLGDDPGQETVTLINTGATRVSLEGWFLLDAMNNRYVLADQALALAAGATVAIALPKNSIQLSNKGGEIRLLNRDSNVAHRVSYTKGQAQEQGRTLLF
ncbi:MAG: lamin tail domain-containing protein [Caldilineaceae bacterium]